MSDHDHDHDQLDPILLAAANEGCEESRLFISRRALLGLTAGLFALPFHQSYAEAATRDADPDRRLLVVILRGGLDGMHVAFTQQEQDTLFDYRAAMLKVAGKPDYLSTNYAALVNTGFKINTGLQTFRDWFASGQAALIHAIAPPLQTRSHFDCADNLENGQATIVNKTRDGWLGRFLAGLDLDQPAASSLQIGPSPLILRGAPGIQSWSNATMELPGDQFYENLKANYLQPRASSAGTAPPPWPSYNGRRSDPLFNTIGIELGQAMTTNKNAIDGSSGTGLGSPFFGAGRLMSKSDGPRIAVMSIGGLDSHASQIDLLQVRLSELDTGLLSFRTALGEALWAKTVVVCVTEFGRNLRENASGTGTDHGTGTVAFIAGGNINGGQVLGNWPGISKTELLENRDLRPMTDTRSLFKAVLKDHLGLVNDAFMAKVFPNSTNVSPMSGLIKTATSGLRLNAGATTT